MNGQTISIHALREEGDGFHERGVCILVISIHALREEGDDPVVGQVYGYGQFLSTPSARRATNTFGTLILKWEISIHALREEGDRLSLNIPRKLGQFLSTPSARRATKTHQL